MTKRKVLFFIYVNVIILQGFSQNLEDLVKQAQDCLVSQRYLEVIEKCTRGIELDSTNKIWYELRGTASFNLKNFYDALRDFEIYIRLAPDDAVGYFRRAMTFGSMEDFDKAAADFTNALEKGGDNAMYYTGRALALYSAGKEEEAMTDLNIAIEIDPYYADAYYDRSVIFYLSDDFYSAIADLEKSIELDKASKKFYNARAQVYFTMAEREENMFLKLYYLRKAQDDIDTISNLN
jgi:tetratricopeptide (TPR) repeat protein